MRYNNEVRKTKKKQVFNRSVYGKKDFIGNSDNNNNNNNNKNLLAECCGASEFT